MYSVQVQILSAAPGPQTPSIYFKLGVKKVSEDLQFMFFTWDTKSSFMPTHNRYNYSFVYFDI